jgi:hypothetical protein
MNEYSLPMTRLAGLGCFRVTMAIPARYWIDPTVDFMAGNIISPVGHAPVGFRLVFDGGLQFGPNPVTIIAKTRLVAHVTDFDLLGRNRPVVFHEHGGVHVAPVRKVFIGLIVTVSAVLEVFTFLFRMLQRRYPPFLGCRTGQNKAEQTEGHAYSQDYFFVHHGLSINIQTGWWS